MSGSISRPEAMKKPRTGDHGAAPVPLGLVFKASVENIEKELQAGLGPRWNVFNKQLLDRLESSLASPDQATAETFITQVRQRAKGQIETPILETLLTYSPAFQKSPANEFLSGFTQIYRTKGHPKAKGIDFQQP